MKLLSVFIVFAVCWTSSIAAVDLGIADDETYKRPNAWSLDLRSPHPFARVLTGDSTGAASRAGLSIAWRNANQVEEVEVRVRNLGDEPGEGKVYVDVLDESGKVLLHLEPPTDQTTIRLPAKDRGGSDGKVLRMKASWELNALIDRFDIAKTRYHVRATVETIGAVDANPLDNSKVKSWHIPFRVRPGLMNSYNYVFTNHQERTVKVSWLFEHTPYPLNWLIEGVPTSPTPFTLNPGETVKGTMFMNAPETIKQGEFVEARLSLVDQETGTIFAQNEWFQIYDTKPPTVTDYRVVSLADGTLAIQAMVSDEGSGILEATGVATQYSVDNGRTWAVKAHNYKVGNFVAPTLFETVIGPFRTGTTVQLRFSAADTAGNVASIIPSDATAITAPPGANVLLQNAYIFPRTQKNPLFEIDKLAEIQKNLKALRKQGVPLEGIDFSKPNAAGVDPERLRSLRIGPSRFPEVVDDLKRIEGINLDFSKVKTAPMPRLNTEIDKFLNITTLEIKAR